MAAVEVLSTERIPEQPRVREVLLFALAEDDGSELPAAVVSDTFDDEMLLPGYEPESGFAESLRALRAGVLQVGEVGAVGAAYTSSLLNPAETWRVRGIGETHAGYASVVVGRLGVGETTIAVAEQDLDPFDIGQEIIMASTRSVAPKLIKEIPRRKVLGSRTIRVEFAADPDQPIIETEVWLPMMRVHRPHHRGCKGWARFEQITGQTTDGSLNFLGMGGGAGEALSARFTDEYPADTECSEWVLKGKLSFRFGTTLVDGTDVGYGMRGDIEGVGSDLVERPIPSDDDGCQRKRDDIPQELWLEKKGLDRTKIRGKAPVSRSCEIERETSGKLSVGVSLGLHASAKISLDFVRTFTTKQSAGANLAPGARYLAYYPAKRNNFEVCWTTL